ncbi:hypothetical protein [Nonomuraea typhae]|uniref:Uncharacterized protein n=1 Tax=Nonomuraea typhae TaxID=2603600 RepID=A0ABW7ZEI2_9ACTN
MDTPDDNQLTSWTEADHYNDAPPATPPHDDSAALTYQRRGHNELIIQGSHPRAGTWHMTVTGEHGLDQRIKISVATGHFAAWMDSPDLFAALARHQPTSLDETITLLNELGATDITAETARRRAEADAALARHFDDLASGGWDDPR